MAGEFSFLLSCELCGQDGFLEDELRHHFKTIHIDGAVSCPFCELSCKNLTSEELNTHVNSAHLEYLTPKKKSKLDDFQSEENVKQTLNTSKHESALIPSKPEDQSKPSTSTHNQAGSSLIKPSDQSNSSPDDVVVCPICEFSASCASDVQAHVNHVHLESSTHENPDHSCPFCQKSFASVFGLELHIESTHESVLNSNEVADESLSCPVCNITTIFNQAEMVSHVEEHFNGLSEAQSTNLRSIRGESSSSSNLHRNDQFQNDLLLAHKLAAEERERQALEEEKQFHKLRAQFGMDNTRSYKQQNLSGMQKAVCNGRLSVQEFYEMQANAREASHIGLDEGHSITRNIMTKLRSILDNSRGVSRAYLSTYVDHHASSFGDDGWGCGYRNLQMLLSSLAHNPLYAERLSLIMDTKNMLVPSIERLQELIEEAWSMGIDRQGCDQLEGKLKNTNKWIGATEIITFLTSRGIQAELLDFHVPTASDGSHPRLFQWVLGYFKSRHDSNQFTPPLFFQHQGHSRTIVGVEETSRNSNSSTRLLVFDPSHSEFLMNKLVKASTNEDAAPILKQLRKPFSSIKSTQYQIVAVTGVFQSQQEIESHKILRSKRIP